MSRRNRALLRTLVPVALMGAIFYFSAQPSTAEHAWWESVLRKLGHVGGYALLTGLWAWALRGVARRPEPLAAGIALAYACTDEIHQTFVDGRNGTPVDVGVDAIGIALAASLMVLRRERSDARTEIDAEPREPRSSLAR